MVYLGVEAEKFMASPMGNYILTRAADHSYTAMEMLKDANPEDTDLIRKLQNEIHRFDDLERWLKEAIHLGDVAHQEIIDERAEE